MGDTGGSRLALTLMSAFNLADLSDEDRAYLNGPICFNTIDGWADSLPHWLPGAIRKERLEMALGLHPKWRVSATEIIAVMYGITHVTPMISEAADLYAWAMSYAVGHRLHDDGTPNPMSREEFFKMLQPTRTIPDSDVLEPRGRLHQIYRDVADEMRRVVLGRKGTLFHPSLPVRVGAPEQAPAPKTVPIPLEVARVLSTSTCEGNILRLPEQLNGDLYEATDKVLRALGGKWHRGKRGHVFASDPAPMIVQALDEGGVIDRKATFQIYETPAEIARRMAAELPEGISVLEPNAGSGRLVKAALLRGASHLRAIELDPENVLQLRSIQAAEPNRLEVVEGDFLGLLPKVQVEGVLMNPPFRAKQDIRHVRHAFEHLAPGGTLMAIMSEGTFFAQDRQAKEFRSWLRGMKSETDKLPAGTFHEEGTDVATRLVKIIKPA